jgi:hypothetical protein
LVAVSARVNAVVRLLVITTKCEIRKDMNFKILILFFAFPFLFGTTATYACRTVKPTTTAMVETAEVIVRVKADKYIEEPKGDIRELNEPSNATINFKVKETLKGDSVPSEIILNGYLSDTDDFNETEIPYNFVRRGGRGGSCSAYEYKRGAEFLLFLKKAGEKYTVRWYALAPTNEQLHSSEDEWITWVRNYLKALKEKEPVKIKAQSNNLMDMRRNSYLVTTSFVKF